MRLAGVGLEVITDFQGAPFRNARSPFGFRQYSKLSVASLQPFHELTPFHTVRTPVAPSNINNHLGDPPMRLLVQEQSVPRRRLDLVVQDVPFPIDRLAADRGLRWQACSSSSTWKQE